MQILYLAILAIILIALPLAADTITGTVVGPDGKPVEGAEAYVTPIGARDASDARRTDAAGTFTVELTPHEFDSSLYGSVNIIAPGLAVGGGRLRKSELVFRLQAPGQAWGSVTDREGNPVAGARVIPVVVNPAASDPARRGKTILLTKQVQTRLAVETTADGRWTMIGLPTTGLVRVQLDDSRFVQTSGEAILGPGAALGEAMVAIPGAVITGRVVHEEGRPAEGVRVFAQGRSGGDGYSDGVTGPEGWYQLRRLPAGSYNVMVDDEAGNWVAAAREGIVVKEGETVTAPDLVLTAGGLVEGTVTDQDTGSPVSGTWVGSYGPHRPRTSAAVIATHTDAQGRYRLRVAPGKSHVYVSGGPPGYLREEHGVDVVMQAGEVKVADFQLKRGVAFHGTAVDEQGQPVAGVYLELQPIKGGGRTSVSVRRSDAAGSIAAEGLNPGTWGVEASAGTGWEVVSPAEVDLSAAGPVKVVVRKSAPTLSATGRVVDPDGKPISGAVVTAAVRPPEGPQRVGRPVISVVPLGGRRLVTDAHGTFVITDLSPASTVQLSASLPGCTQVSGGAVRFEHGGFVVEDIVLAKLSARVRGRGVDGQGRPVAQAIILAVEGGPKAHGVTDADGQFALEGLPAGEVEVLAAYDHSFGRARGRADGDAEPVTVTLTPRPQAAPGEVKLGYTILERVWRESEGKDYYARENLPCELASRDPEMALKLATGPEGAVSDRALSGILFPAAETRAPGATEWALPYLPRLRDPAIRGMVAARLGLALVTSQPDVARRLYQEAARDLAKVPPTAEPWPGDLAGRSMLVPLAGRLGEPDTEAKLAKLMADATETAHKLGEENRGLVEAVIDGVAYGGVEMAEKALALSGLDGRGRMDALADAVTEISQFDPAGAYRLIAAIEPPEEETQAYYYGVGVKAVIEAMGERDPAAALALARRVPSSDQMNQRGQALALAAQYQPANTRAEVFREAARAANGEANNLAWIAARAFLVDPELGEELFGEARRAISGDLLESSGRAEFAFYYSQVAPAKARMMMEAEYRNARAPGQGRRRQSPLAIALAMAAVDVDRALEMARALPDSAAGARFDAQRKIAQYVLASDFVRRTMPFDRWTASDTWIPGTPSGW